MRIRDDQYLIRRGRTYYVWMEVPKDLRAVAGQSRLKQTLGTDSLAAANARKWTVVARFKDQISLWRRAVTDKGTAADAALFRQAAEDHAWLKSTAGRTSGDDARSGTTSPGPAGTSP